MCFTKRIYLFLFNKLESFNETRPLVDLIKYDEIKKDLKKSLELKLETQNCSIKSICLTIVNKNKYKFKDWYQFSKKYFFFEYKSSHVFKINHLEMWFITSENYIFRSKEVLNNTGFIFFLQGKNIFIFTKLFKYVVICVISLFY